MPTVPTSQTEAELAQHAWPVLRDWLADTRDGRRVLDRFTSDPDREAATLRNWLHTHGADAPPQLATYVQGGQVDKLVNIAHAGVVQTIEIRDTSGWWAFSEMRGLPRRLVVLGVVLCLAAFACLGYPVVKAIATYDVGRSEAEQACYDQFPPGPARNECLFEASRAGGPQFEATPWIPLGAVLAFAGLASATAGSLLFWRGPASST